MKTAEIKKRRTDLKRFVMTRDAQVFLAAQAQAVGVPMQYLAGAAIVLVATSDKDVQDKWSKLAATLQEAWKEEHSKN